jgi:hypothetical protein
MDWSLAPCLVALRAEFNALAPGRDKGADGSIGDSAHTGSSDHTPDEQSDVLRDRDGDSKNEVHALDIDSSGPWPGEGTQKQRFHRFVMGIVAREKARWLDPDDVCRLEYVIWDGHIYSRAFDFREREFTGDDPHTNHAHFSSRYLTTAENDTRPWGVQEDDDMAFTETQLKAFPWQQQARKAQAGDPDMSTLAVLTGTYDKTKALLALVASNATAEAQRDAAQSAAIAGMMRLLNTVVETSGTMTQAQLAALTDQIAQAAAEAGAKASAAVMSKLDSLRAHLGDDEG